MTATATETVPAGLNTLSGGIRYYNAAGPVPAVTVRLHGAVELSAQTDAAGQFAIPNLPSGTLSLQPEKQGDFDGGINAFDLVYAIEAAAGVRKLTAAQQLACDVSGNGKVTAVDVALILDHILRGTRFPVALQCGSDWVFVPSPATAPNQQVIQPRIASGSCQPGAVTFDPLVASASNQDFTAILFGDCTGNWQPAGAATGGGASAPNRRTSLARSVLRRLYAPRSSPPHLLLNAPSAFPDIEATPR